MFRWYSIVSNASSSLLRPRDDLIAGWLVVVVAKAAKPERLTFTFSPMIPTWTAPVLESSNASNDALAGVGRLFVLLAFTSTDRPLIFCDLSTHGLQPKGRLLRCHQIRRCRPHRDFIKQRSYVEACGSIEVRTKHQHSNVEHLESALASNSVTIRKDKVNTLVSATGGRWHRWRR